MILMLARFIAALSSYGKNSQLAFALSVGILLGLIPPGNLIWFLLFIPMMLIRVNQAAFLVALGIGRLVSILIDPISERLGFFVLNQAFLYEPMGKFLSQPVLSWTRLDDSLVAGSLLISLLLCIPLYVAALAVVKLYRKHLAGRVKSVFRSLGKKLPWLGRLIRALGNVRPGVSR